MSLVFGLVAVSPGAEAAPKAPEPAPFAQVTAAPPAAKLPAVTEDGPKSYSGVVDKAQLEKVLAVGADRHETEMKQQADGKTSVEVILTPAQAEKLKSAGVQLTSDTAKSRALAPPGDGVYKPYSGPDGLGAEMVKLAQEHPDIAKVVSFGKSGLGQDMLAVRVTKDARKSKDGSKPASLYMSNQHAREWITPETTRRLLTHYVNSYGKDKDLTKLINDNEYWFVLSANPDGYDWSRQPGQRLWRKNLRDNNADGKITAGDGVDLNRNFGTKWGWDNEGSSPDPFSETYRGPGPDSEPETKAIESLVNRIDPRFIVNWHSAAELILYGVGWQVETDSPDNIIAKALAGDDAKPAVPGYDPDLSAELYTTNGDSDGWFDEGGEAISFTPEMSTCDDAAGRNPNDEWVPEDCTDEVGSIFGFPDDEELIQQEYANNLPFALSIAKSTEQPDEPVSSLGIKVPALKADAFPVSYASKGDFQEVAVIGQRRTKDLQVNYSVNGKKAKTDGVREWRGGERYGNSGTNWYSEYRGRVENLNPGDKVEVWFTGKQFPGNGQGGGKGKKIESDHFTFTVASGIDKDAKALVLADEDIKGVNPVYPAGVSGPKYVQSYVDSLAKAGVKSAVWNMDTQGVPHHLGVLSHFKGVAWYLGDNRFTQAPEDEFVKVGSTQQVADSQVADREQWTTIAVRDYLNEGGKLLYTGETAANFGPLRGLNGGGIYFGLNGAPEKPCVISTGYQNDCLILSDDFAQYYLGAFSRTSVSGATGITATEGPLAGTNVTVPGSATNPLNEAGGFLPTGKVLPVDKFPQFGGQTAGAYTGDVRGPLAPVEGVKYVAGPHMDTAYYRLTRTIDLTNVSAADLPKLQAQLSWDAEVGYDYGMVEAHTVGADDWTTLPDQNGGTTQGLPDGCGGTVDGHAFLGHYLTPATGGAECLPQGTTGQWNVFNGTGGGWKQTSFDLSAYVGKQVEVSISYVSDGGVGGDGMFVDDTKVVTNSGVLDAEGFETGLGPWTIAGPPPGDHTSGSFLHSASVYENAGIYTEDTVLLGFGLEQLAPADRDAVMRKVVKHLFG